MAIHTAQHLLSAILDTYNLPTLSWSMTQYPSLDCPYIELPRGLTWAEVQEVEDKCNALIDADVSVWVETSMQQEEKGVNAEEGDRESRGIPKDYEGVSTVSACLGNWECLMLMTIGGDQAYQHRWNRPERMLRYSSPIIDPLRIYTPPPT